VARWFTDRPEDRHHLTHLILAVVMLVRGIADAVMMRAQRAIAFGRTKKVNTSTHHFDQIFRRARTSPMIFFVTIPR